MEIDLTKMWDEYNLGHLQQEMSTLFPQYSFHLGDLFKDILSGDILGTLSNALESVIRGLSTELVAMKEVLIWLLVLGVIAALISHFVEVFENHQIADIGFYFVYLLLITILLKCFQTAAFTAADTIDNIVSFIRLFIPTYFVAVGVSTGTTTATAYYMLLLLLIYVVEKVLQAVILPMIYSYVLLAVINGVWSEERLSLLIEFLEKAIRFILKASLGIVTGISIVQSMITPIIDSVKATAMQKTIAAIPGVGDAADGVMNVVIGSAVVIKNSIGVVMLILLLAVCAAPLARICLTACLLKLAAAFLGLISDKRITASTDKVGNGSNLLFRAAGTALMLFLITISIAAYTTNRGF